MNEIAFTVSLALVVGILIFTLDDLFIDLVALVRGLKPRLISAEEQRYLRLLPRKRIAILIANWKEHDVLECMIRGNVAGIDYGISNYSFFLGVYPNDLPTWEAARALESNFPHVFVIVNALPGPTSKGQLLNEMMRRIIGAEEITRMKHDLFMLHDSEDLIHPLSFQLINAEADDADFVQMPVFSLPVEAQCLVAGVYMDEFAESHTKEMLVRAALGAGIPSAGVGTAISRELALRLLELQGGSFLNENCLTEDYQLGLLAARLGFRSTFVCAYRLLPSGKKDFFATREYFPEGFRASVRQKTRWTIGIAFQSAKHLGWHGSRLDRYFLWRDRRGPLNAVLLTGASLVVLYFMGYAIFHDAHLPSFTASPWFVALATINFSQMILRLLQRMRLTAAVYGTKACLLVPLRWPVGNLVNTWAAWRAFRVYRDSEKKGTQPIWIKTQHKLPEKFGRAPIERMVTITQEMIA